MPWLGMILFEFPDERYTLPKARMIGLSMVKTAWS